MGRRVPRSRERAWRLDRRLPSSSTTPFATSATSASRRATARRACACALPSSHRSPSARSAITSRRQARSHPGVVARARLEDKLFGRCRTPCGAGSTCCPSSTVVVRTTSRASRKNIERIATTNPLASLFKLWLETRGAVQPERLERLIREGLQGRYVIVQTGETKADVFLREVGPRLPVLRRPAGCPGQARACASRISRTTSTAMGGRGLSHHDQGDGSRAWRMSTPSSPSRAPGARVCATRA